MRNRNHRKTVYRKALSLLLCLALCAGLAGCTTLNAFKDSISSVEEDERAIKIGVFEPLSGVDKQAAALEIRGIELAHELFPTALNRPVELVYGDNRSDIATAERMAEELVDSGISVALGSYDNLLSLAGKHVFEQHFVPVVAITNTNPLVTAGSEYSVRVCYVDAFQGVAAAKYIYEDLGIGTVAVWKERDDDYGTAMAQSFTEKFNTITGNPNAVSMTMEFGPDQTDFSSQLFLLENAGVKTVYMPCSAEKAALLIEVCRDAGLKLRFIGSDRWESGNILQYSDRCDGAAFTSVFAEGAELTERAHMFREAYSVRYGEEEIPEAVALGFDAYLFAITAIETAGTASQGSVIKDTMCHMKGFEGVTGSITLNVSGDPIRSFIVKKVQGDAYVYEDKAEPKWDGEQPQTVAPLDDEAAKAAAANPTEGTLESISITYTENTDPKDQQ